MYCSRCQCLFNKNGKIMGQHVDPIRREKASYKQLNLGKLTSAFVQLLVAIYSLGELLCC